MAVHVICNACKKQVPFGRLFCTYCGAKLELTQENVTSRLTVDEAFAGVKKLVIRIISLAVLAGIVGVFIWPMAPQGQVGNAAHATLCEQKISSARVRALNGVVFMEQFQEMEVNAALADRLKKTTDTAAGSGFQLTDVNVTFLPGKVVVNTQLTWSKVVLSYEADVVPSVGPQGFKHEVTAMRIGHVPVPGPALEFLSGRALNVFAEMRAEGELLAKMKQLVVEKGVVRVSNQGK